MVLLKRSDKIIIKRTLEVFVLKRSLMFIMTILSIILLVGCGGNSSQGKSEDTKEKQLETANLNAIKTTLKVDDAKAKPILDVLKAVGYTNITSVTGTMGGQLGLTIRSPQTDPAIAVMFTDTNGKIQKVVFKNQVLYENDKPKGKIQDSIMGKYDKSRVVNAVERAIKKNAHDPSSVQMISNQQFVVKVGGVFEARGQFRAKNGFGALTLHKYEAWLDSNYKVRELREIR